MKIKVLFFGATADAAGRRAIELDTSAVTADGALAEVVATYPGLSKHRLLFSLNESYVTPSEALNEGDELAIFTAVSGG